MANLSETLKMLEIQAGGPGATAKGDKSMSKADSHAKIANDLRSNYRYKNK